MFADDRQLALCCDALTRWMGNGRLWTVEGLTATGLRLAKRMGPLSTGEKLMLKFALSLWNSYEWKGPRTDEILHSLDPTRMQMVTSLMLAAHAGSAAVESWLKRYHPDLRDAAPAAPSNPLAPPLS